MGLLCLVEWCFAAGGVWLIFGFLGGVLLLSAVCWFGYCFLLLICLMVLVAIGLWLLIVISILVFGGFGGCLVGFSSWLWLVFVYWFVVLLLLVVVGVCVGMLLIVLNIVVSFY